MSVTRGFDATALPAASAGSRHYRRLVSHEFFRARRALSYHRWVQ